MTATQATGTHIACVLCKGEVETDERVLLGEVLHCSHCNAQLEVFELDPVQIGLLRRVEEEEEDFEGWPKAG